MTLIFAFTTCMLSLRGLASLDAVGRVAQLPAGDSLTISGVVLSHVGVRQLGARVRVARHSPIDAGASRIVAATWTNQRGEFQVKIGPAEAADQLRLQAFCAARPRALDYLWGAEQPVELNRRLPYTIRLQKRRIYPKIR
jgi:hypothetical protein